MSDSVREASLSAPVPHRGNLKASSADAAAFGVMVGSGETYIPAFALALGLGEVFAGLIASVPMAIGGWLQLLTSGYAARVRDQQRWIVVWAGLQGCVFFGLALLAIIEVRSWWPVLVCASLYWTCGLAAGPCWNTWIGGLVAPRLRPKFFAFRTLLCQFCTLFGLVAGGWLLSLGNGIAAAFALTFTFAGLWRLISVWFLGRHQMPERIFRDPERTLALDRAGAGKAGRQLIVYLVATQGMVQLAGPYLTPLMLHHLQMSYGWFVALTGVGFAAKAIALRTWPRLVARSGAASLLKIGGIGVALVPMLWLVAWHPAWLLVVQAFTGAFTAAYELGFSLMFFETLPASKRTRVLSWYNTANSTAWCAGSLLGAAWLWGIGGSEFAYTALLAASLVGRIAALGLLFQMPVLRHLRVRWQEMRSVTLSRGNSTSRGDRAAAA